MARKSTTDLSDAEDKLITDENAIADQEARNGLLQFDEVGRLVRQFSSQKKFDITPELIQNLNRIAIQGLRRSAGHLRLVPISITNTLHTPPPHSDVPRLMSEMCEYVNSHWDSSEDEVQSAVHVASYLMWRLNWIHPFRDGNGRTSRAISYLAMCTRLGQELAGTPTIADQIVDNKIPYYEALDAADAAWRKGIVDVSDMENLIRELLVVQLSSVPLNDDEI